MKTERLLRSLGEEVRELRTKLDISQEILAAKAGVHRNVIGRLERGTYNTSILTLLSIAIELDTSLSDLIAAAERRTR
jgi:transcriptional regulator with XRE-family HTH domain